MVDHGFDIRKPREFRPKFWIYGAGIAVFGLSAASEGNDDWHWAALVLLIWTACFPLCWGLGRSIANWYRTGHW